VTHTVKAITDNLRDRYIIWNNRICCTSPPLFCWKRVSTLGRRSVEPSESRPIQNCVGDRLAWKRLLRAQLVSGTLSRSATGRENVPYGHRMRIVTMLVAGLVALAGCGGGEGPTPGAPVAQSSEPTAVAESETPEPEPVVTPSIDPTLYPKGFPKVVSVSGLPDQVRSWYEMSDLKRAVAIAPGVWTELPPGAEMEDALATEVRDGFCGSVKSYERKYLAGTEGAGTCW
jgi:hypothetical protein